MSTCPQARLQYTRWHVRERQPYCVMVIFSFLQLFNIAWPCLILYCNIETECSFLIPHFFVWKKECSFIIASSCYFTEFMSYCESLPPCRPIAPSWLAQYRMGSKLIWSCIQVTTLQFYKINTFKYLCLNKKKMVQNMLLNATFKRFSPHYLRLLHSRILVDGAMVVQCGVAFIESSFMNESDTGRRSRVLSLRDGSKKTRSLPRIVV